MTQNMKSVKYNSNSNSNNNWEYTVMQGCKKSDALTYTLSYFNANLYKQGYSDQVMVI